ncbi:MAG: tRNA (N(6)-L-threonylcarbamoyladenosine(37)-C(2))-methylthiotransferase [Halococcoides sp.]
MARYYTETFGCTSNRGETQAIERELLAAGHRPVETASAADVAILNTCTVVETTEDRMRRRAAALDDAVDRLVITGCMALAQEEVFEAAEIDAECCHWEDVPDRITNGECPTPPETPTPLQDGVVGILPIARGCLSDCSYCITKQATGTIDSPPIETNVARAKRLIEDGAREIRVTGQDTAVYGRDRGEAWLPELLDRICALDGEFRVRVGMANPKGVHAIAEELAAVFAANDELYNFLHAPIQSGSDAVLEDMRRRHRTADVAAIIETFDRHLEEWTFATDVIAGFPTETDSDHRATVAALREHRPEKINVTRFSKRPGTDAAAMDGLGGQTKKDRSKDLTAVKMEIVGAAHEAMVGDEREVLFTEDGTGESLVGYDRTHRQVAVPGAASVGYALGDRVRVEITDHERVYALGKPV